MRVLLCSLMVLTLAALGGCQLVYKLPTRQGNVIEQKKLDQLALGMSREQVRFLLGTPLAADPYNEDRWDYLGFYRAPRGTTTERVVTLYFEGDRLARMEGVDNSSRNLGGNTTLEAVVDAEEKRLLEKERAESEAERGLQRPEPDAP
jgi:outer membrane protein assembly factor BamE